MLMLGRSFVEQMRDVANEDIDYFHNDFILSKNRQKLPMH